MKNIIKSIKNIFYSKEINCTDFTIENINNDLLKKYHDIGWFCHEALHHQLIKNIIDMYKSGSFLKIVYHKKERTVESLIHDLKQLGLDVKVLKTKPLFSLFGIICFKI